MKKTVKSVISKIMAIVVSIILVSQAMPFLGHAITEESFFDGSNSGSGVNYSELPEQNKTDDNENENDLENKQDPEQKENEEPQKEEKQYKIIFEYNDNYKDIVEIKLDGNQTREINVSESEKGKKLSVSIKLKDDKMFSYQLTKVSVYDYEKDKYSKIINDSYISGRSESKEGATITINDSLLNKADDKNQIHINVYIKKQAKEYTLKFLRNHTGTSTIKVNGKDVDTNDIVVSAGSSIKLSLASKDDTNNKKYYRLASVTSNGNILINKETIGEKTNYTCSLKIDEQLVNNEKDGVINIKVNTMRVYIVQVQYDSTKGSIDYKNKTPYYYDAKNAEKTIGKVLVGVNKSQQITAEAAEHYRVSEIIVKNVSDENVSTINKKYSNNKTKVTYTLPSQNKNYEVNVVFAPIILSVDVEIVGDSNGCKVVVPKSVEYGEDVDIKITDKTGYFISSVSIDGEAMELPEREGNQTISFNTGSITNNKKIIVTIEKSNVVSESDYSIDLSGYIVDYGNGKYLFPSNNNPPVFKNVAKNSENVQQKGIMIYNKGKYVSGSKNSLECKLTRDENLKAVTIDEIVLYSSQANKNVTDRIKLDVPIEINYYERTEACVKLPDLPSINKNCKAYNSDVDIPVYFNIPTERYPHIVSLKYRLNDEEYQEVDVTTITDSDELSGYNKKCLIHIPSEKYNKENIFAEIIIDNSDGNKTELKTDVFSINSIRPTVSINMEDKESSEFSDESYFRFNRKATITISDKKYTSISDIDYIADALKIEYRKLNSKDYNLFSKKQKKQMISSIESSEDEIIVKLLFDKEGYYFFEFNYTNAANLNNDGYISENKDSDFSFCIDKTVPKGKFIVNGNKFDTKSAEYDPKFKYFYNKPAVIQADVSDNDEIREVSFYKRIIGDLSSVNVNKLTFDELEELYHSEESPFDKDKDIIEIDENKKTIVYARVVDFAGNILYIGTDGFIVDNTVPELLEFIAYDKDGKILNDINENNVRSNIIDDIQNNVIRFSVKVNDAVLERSAYSGIKNVYYVVEKDGKRIKDSNGEELHNIYKWNEKSEKLTDAIIDVPLTFELDPFVDENYNCDDFTVRVLIYDNAGNLYDTTESYIKLSINIDIPDYTIKFINGVKPDAHEGYYVSRKAIITVSNDRKTSFDSEAFEKAVRKAVTASELIKLDGTVIDKKAEDLISFDEWKSDENDTSIHTVNVYFNYYGNYYFDNIYYTNKAHNDVVNKDQYNEHFTIDNIAPTGEIKIGNNTWDKILKILTFGIYSSEKYEIKVSSDDRISPIKTDYFISNSDKMLSIKELSAVNWNNYSGIINFDGANQKFAVYVRVADYAGNIIYLSSEGHIIDQNAPLITLNPEKAVKKLSGVNVYNQNYKNGVKIDVKVSDGMESDKAYSGIKHIEYWVENKGKADEPIVIYDWKFIRNEDDLNSGTENPEFTHGTIEIQDNGKYKKINDASLKYNQLIKEWSGTINIDAKKYNSSDIVVKVKAIDNTDLTTIQSVKMDIDITPPSISLLYDNNNDNNGNSYFNASRNAVITIKERSSHFDPIQASNSIVINAVDVLGKKVPNTFKISNWTTKNANDEDETIHTATIAYNGDANYTFSISYTDMAQNNNGAVNTNNSVSPYRFTVDKNKPTGKIQAVSAEGRKEEWSALRSSLLFNFWSNEYIVVSETHNDVTSPIDYIQYYKDTSYNAYSVTRALTESELEKVTDWHNMTTLKITPNEQCAIYIRLIDRAGNVTYMSTNAFIVDDKAPIEKLMPLEIKITPEQTASGIYNADVKVNIEVEDPTYGYTYSGIRSISYRVLNMGNVTDLKTLYQFSDTDAATQSNLKKLWKGDITVKSKDNNSNNVVVEVTAVDNAGNTSRQNIALKIDITKPSVSVSYNNNSSIGELYKNDRIVTVIIQERNFRKDYVDITINNKRLSYDTLKWTKNAGTGNGDNDEWRTTVEFTNDGDYTFGVKCRDEAANDNSGVSYGNSTNWNKFTIDKTKPVISVEFTDNSLLNSANYSQQNLTAKVVIDELHFKGDNVKFTKIADNVVDDIENGGWSQENGTNRHYVNVNFDKDAHYTFSVDYTDEAGNDGESKQKSFCIDTKDPEIKFNINGSSERQAVSGKLEAVITYGDVNFDDASVSVSGNFVNGSTGVIKNNRISFDLRSEKNNVINWQGDVKEDDVGGKKTYTFTMDDFPSDNSSENNLKEFDDIYTMDISVNDKAGRNTSKTVVFSVNRYGSTYDIKNVKDIIGKYIQTPSDIVITEINPDVLTSNKVTLYKNSDRQNNNVLEKDKNYILDEKLIGSNNMGNGSMKESDIKWHEYTYTISSENFADDGDYEIELESVDKAGNVSKNNLDTKERSIFFHVDKNKPIVDITNLLSGTTYAEEKISIKMAAKDGGMLNTIEVYLDDQNKPFKVWNADEIVKIQSEGDEESRLFTFDIPGNTTSSHYLKVVATDAAGNKSEKIIDNFYVTTDLMTRFVNNKPLFYGTIIGAILLIGVIVLIIVRSARKKKT